MSDYVVQVTANDGAGGTSVQTLSVFVTAVNEFNPVFTSSAARTLIEFSTFVSIVTATDADLPSQTLTYSITGGDDLTEFSITSAGVLTFISPRDFEAPTDSNGDNVYIVQVTASDGAEGTAAQTLSVSVTGINDNPVFTSAATPSVPENTTSVLTVTATDVDLPAQTVTYSITGGDDQSKFSITSGGLLSFIVAPDCESPTDFDRDNVYVVQVMASDGAGGTNRQVLFVSVTGVDEFAPFFTSTSTPSVPENTTKVLTIRATDPDLPAQPLTYSITGGVDQAKFSITSAGVLTFVAPPDFETPTDANGDNVYLVEVAASDDAGGQATQALSVSVRRGFRLVGGAAGDRAGRSVANVGDINGDGLDDLLIGAPEADPNGLSNAGTSYLVFGTPEGSQTTLNLSAINGTNGFAFHGLALGDLSGYSVSGAGDVNGDGFGDLMIGAPYANPNGALTGQTYLVFGGPTNFQALDKEGGAAADGQINLAALNGTTGYIFNGIAPFDLSGDAISGGGDVNGDGFADIVIGAHLADPHGFSSGQSYLVFGGPAKLSALDLAGGAADGRINLAALNGSTGFIFNGPSLRDSAGVSISSSADLNGDGFADLVIGAPNTIVNGLSSGRTYVVFGGVSNLAALDVADSATANGQVELSLVGGTRGYVIDAGIPSGRFGVSVDDAGDVNGDGARDLLIGAANAAGTGQSYLVFGGAANMAALDTAGGGALDGRFALSALNGTNGFILKGIGANDFAGYSASGVGDINGDGIADMLVAASNADSGGTNSGSAYLIYGGLANLAALDAADVAGADGQISLSALNGTNGFPLNGLAPGDSFGREVSGAGDLNGDGFADLLIGAYLADANGVDSGESYVLYGGNSANHSPVFTSIATPSVPENTTSVLTVTATDSDSPSQTVTFAITGGVDQGKFSITAGGVLSFLGTPDFENPTDANGDNIYVVQVTANDGAGGSAVQSLSVSVTAVNEFSPLFSSTATPSIPENTTSVLTVTATDADLPAQTVTFAITGGADQVKFSITAGGALSFLAAPDFENPADADANNVYLLQVTASDGSGGTTVQNLSVAVTNVVEAIPGPTVTLSVSPATAAEAGGKSVVTARLSALSTTSTTIALGFSGTATLTADYTRTATSIVIPAGQLTGITKLFGVQDTLVEGNETIIVDILTVTNGTENGTQQVTATIVDDDTGAPSLPTVTLGLTGSPMAEAGGVATVTATLSVVSAQAVTVNLDFTGIAGNPSDYTRSATSIVIPAGSLSGSITLTAAQDSLSEPSETIIVDIGSVTNGTESGVQQVTATITDDDSGGPTLPTVTLSVSPATAAEGGGKSIVTATLSTVSTTSTTIALGFSGTATLTSDYTRTAISIVIPAGQLTGLIKLFGVQDTLVEGNETIIVDILTVTNGTESSTQQVTTTIVDDDVATVQALVAASGAPTSDSNTEPSNPMTLAGQLITPSDGSKNVARLFDDFNSPPIPMSLIDDVFAKANSLLFG